MPVARDMLKSAEVMLCNGAGHKFQLEVDLIARLLDDAWRIHVDSTKSRGAIVISKKNIMTAIPASENSIASIVTPLGCRCGRHSPHVRDDSLDAVEALINLCRSSNCLIEQIHRRQLRIGKPNVADRDVRFRVILRS